MYLQVFYIGKHVWSLYRSHGRFSQKTVSIANSLNSVIKYWEEFRDLMSLILICQSPPEIFKSLFLQLQYIIMVNKLLSNIFKQICKTFFVKIQKNVLSYFTSSWRNFKLLWKYYKFLVLVSAVFWPRVEWKYVFKLLFYRGVDKGLTTPVKKNIFCYLENYN